MNDLEAHAILAGLQDIKKRVRAQGRLLMGINAQVRELTTAIDGLKTAVNGTIERQAQKIDSLQAALEAAGEVDPNIQSHIDAVRAETTKLEGFMADNPTPGEPTVPDEGEASPGGFTPDEDASTDIEPGDA